MDKSVAIVDTISQYLDSEKYKEALSVSNDEKYLESFKDNCWDLITVITSKIEDNTDIIKPSLHKACEELLTLIVQRAHPEEALLEFIEQLEVAKNDAQFIITLHPLQELLTKLIKKRGNFLEWCFNSISTYIEKIPMSDLSLEHNERVLLDCDTNVRRIIKIYSHIPSFYQPVIKEIATTDLNKNMIRAKEITTAFLISLLGIPLIYIDLDPDYNAKSEARMCCNLILQDICTLERNVVKFLSFFEVFSRKTKKVETRSDNYDSNISPYEQKEKINMTSLSGLFYAVFSGHFDLPDNAIPQVYSVEYIIHNTMLSIIHLLSFSEFGPMSKGIALFKAILNRMYAPVTHSVLSLSIHYETCKALMSVAIYCSHESIRKDAVNLIGQYVNKFDYRGRTMLIKFLVDVSNHSGMIGYAITLYKNSIDQAFKTGTTLPVCFTGEQLEYMIKKICHLPHGAESDIVEIADQIISSLNFLRYLVIKDINNLTGIKECFTFIENGYLSQLRTGLNMSKAHYEVKLKDIEEEKRLPKEHLNISLNVGGNILDTIPLENKKEIVISALNAFHLIEGLMARLSECMNLSKIQNLNMGCN